MPPVRNTRPRTSDIFLDTRYPPEIHNANQPSFGISSDVTTGPFSHRTMPLANDTDRYIHGLSSTMNDSGHFTYGTMSTNDTGRFSDGTPPNNPATINPTPSQLYHHPPDQYFASTPQKRVFPYDSSTPPPVQRHYLSHTRQQQRTPFPTSRRMHLTRQTPSPHFTTDHRPVSAMVSASAGRNSPPLMRPPLLRKSPYRQQQSGSVTGQGGGVSGRNGGGEFVAGLTSHGGKR